MKKLGLGLLATSIIFLGGCTKKADNSPSIMKINDKVITEKMFKKNFEHSFNSSALARKGIDLKEQKNQFTYMILKSKAVNDLVIEELIKQEADKRGIEVSDQEVDDTVKEIISKFGNKAQFEKTLSLNNIDKKVFKEKIKFDLLKNKLVDNVSGKIEISDKKAQEFYDKNKDKHFMEPEKVRARHILINISEADIKSEIAAAESNKNLTDEQLDEKVQEQMNQAKNKAEKILAELKADPEKFAELAKKYSEDPSSAEKGGDLGFFTKEEMVAPFAEAAFNTKPGKLSDVVKTSFGYHIIKVEDRQKGGSVPFDEVKADIKKYIESKEKMDSLAQLIESSKQSAEIVYINNEYNPEYLRGELQKLAQEKMKELKNQQEVQ